VSERREPTLSTADLASGRERPAPDQTDEPVAVERRETEVEPRAAGPAVADRGEEGAARPTPLFPSNEGQDFQSRWDTIQAGFVDEPRRAVEQADGLVAEMMQRLAQVFAEERSKLEEQWSRGDNISTEDLRVALQRYRSFFDRLLSV
jgi:hypothetical protein